MNRFAPSIRFAAVAVRSATRLRRWRLGHALATFAWAFVGGFDNRANFHIDRNGESILLQRIASFAPSLLFDVGANVGEWTRVAATTCPSARVHAFEPVPATATQLRLATARFGPRVVVHEVALGARAERRRVAIDVERSSLVSLLDAPNPTSERTVDVDVVVGAQFCSMQGIEHIDLLKIDAEGTDHLVLAGFEEMLRTKRVAVVQFEYGKWALETKFLLKDFYAMFDAHGYVVGKLFPRGVAFGPYRTRLEDFRGLNFVAVDASRPDLVDALSER